MNVKWQAISNRWYNLLMSHPGELNTFLFFTVEETSILDNIFSGYEGKVFENLLPHHHTIYLHILTPSVVLMK